MVHLSLSGVSVDFPVFTSQTMGLINTLFGFRGRARLADAKAGGHRAQVHALSDITLDFKPGDRVGLIGRNGAGKSTLLRVLSGVYEPAAGTISSEGSISALTDLMLGMDPEASGYEFILTRCIVMGLSREQARQMTPEVEAFVEMDLELPVRTYSSGMLLRLAFAVATATIPEILLMDEMIGVGDAQFIVKATERLKRLMSQVQILVLASHNAEILREFCNKGVLLANGRVIMTGTLEACLQEHLKGT